MMPGERYLKALAAITSPAASYRTARSLAEIDGATTQRATGRIETRP